jgi:hypothetical protein
MALQQDRWWRLVHAILTHNIFLHSGFGAADARGARDRRGPRSMHAIDTARWEDRGA